MNGSIRYQEISSEATSRITPGVDHESKSFDGIEAQNPSNSRSNSSEDDFLADFEDDENPKSTMWGATVNLVKLCIGTGVLALPYAVQKGGLILSPICIGLVALWNYTSCEQMMECKRAASGDRCPREVSSTYGRIAYCACGWLGVYVTDFCIIVTLLGVCVTYLITFTTLLQSVPSVTLNSDELSMLAIVVMFPLCVQKDVSRLSGMSILGLLCLLVGICAIAFFGVARYGQLSTYSATDLLPLWCSSMSDFATFVGIAAFGFGTCSLAFPVEESMKDPSSFPKAARYSLVLVWIVYTFVGDCIAYLFVHDSRGISSNILRNLPVDAVSAHLVKVALAVSCVLTLPLAFIPPAQMIEKKLLQLMFLNSSTDASPLLNNEARDSAWISEGGEHEPIAAGHIPAPQSRTQKMSRSGSPPCFYGSGTAGAPDGQDPYWTPVKQKYLNIREVESPLLLRVLNRATLMVLIAAASLSVPCFGLIISLLGSFTVAILSFVLPPLFSLLIISRHVRHDNGDGSRKFKKDCILIALGSSTAVCATIIVSLQGLESLQNGAQC